MTLHHDITPDPSTRLGLPSESPLPTPPAGPGGPAGPGAPQTPKGTWPRRAGFGALLLAVAVGGGATGAAVATSLDDSPSTSAAVDLTGAGSAPVQSLAKVAAAVQPSVVSVQVTTAQGGGEGSGVILDSDGTIVTNNHVVEGAQTVRVSFTDGTSTSATVVGTDPANDLAVIKADGVSGLTPVTLGTADSLHVGDTVVAIGSPLGLDGSVTSGIVSALHRTVDLGSNPGSTALVGDAIQTDAAINPGNSGGALVDAEGRLVGINVAIASLNSTGGQSGNIGVGFAIPVDEVQRVADQLIAGETPTHAILGVQISNSPDGGAVLQVVTQGSAAAQAGLRVGDVIVKVDDRTIDTGTDLAGAVRAHAPGDTVSVTFVRDGNQRTVDVTLDSAS
jgi:putative serine protease PepD